MKTSTTARLASFAAALLITFTTVHSLANYGLPPVANTVVAFATLSR